MSVKKIMVMTDLEGVSGVVSFCAQAYADGRYYEQARKLVTAEVNAAVDAMVEAGVEEILVVDGHGPGGICYEQLHSAARLLHGRPISWRQACGELMPRYDATMLIGQHAMAGTARGNLNHTECSRTIEYYKLNGSEIGEMAQWALFAGALGVATIFLSGDQAACDEAVDLIPQITTACVKEGLSRTSAISVSMTESHRRIRAGVTEAIRKQNVAPLPPCRWAGPYVLEKRFLFTETADTFEGNALYERIDAKTVRLRSDDILDIIYA